MFQPTSLNPYSAALHKKFDSEFQEEPVSVLNVQYTKAAEYSCFKPMKDSPLFQSFKEQNFS